MSTPLSDPADAFEENDPDLDDMFANFQTTGSSGSSNVASKPATNPAPAQRTTLNPIPAQQQTQTQVKNFKPVNTGNSGNAPTKQLGQGYNQRNGKPAPGPSNTFVTKNPLTGSSVTGVRKHGIGPSNQQSQSPQQTAPQNGNGTQSSWPKPAINSASTQQQPQGNAQRQPKPATNAPASNPGSPRAQAAAKAAANQQNQTTTSSPGNATNAPVNTATPAVIPPATPTKKKPSKMVIFIIGIIVLIIGVLLIMLIAGMASTKGSVNPTAQAGGGSSFSSPIPTVSVSGTTASTQTTAIAETKATTANSAETKAAQTTVAQGSTPTAANQASCNRVPLGHTAVVVWVGTSREVGTILSVSDTEIDIVMNPEDGGETLKFIRNGNDNSFNYSKSYKGLPVTPLVWDGKEALLANCDFKPQKGLDIVMVSPFQPPS